MSRTTKLGCFRRLLQFTFLGLFILAAVVYFFCIYAPPFKLTPERVGWDFPPGTEIPLTADGKFVDHIRAFEMTRPELFKNPRKNGWRRVLLAMNPEYFRKSWLPHAYRAKHPEDLNARGLDDLVNRWNSYPELAEKDPEICAWWDATWRLYCQKMDISPEECTGTHTPAERWEVLKKEVGELLIARALEYAETHPKPVEAENDSEDDSEESFAKKTNTWPLTDSYFVEKDSPYADLEVPYELCHYFPWELEDRLTYGSWTPEEFPKLAAYIESQSEFLEALAQAVREELFFPVWIIAAEENGEKSWIDWQASSHLRSFTYLLSTRAAMRHGTGDIKGALTDVETMILMARHIQRSPHLSDYLIGMAIESPARQVVNRNLSLHRYTREDLEFLLDLWKETPPLRPAAEFVPEHKIMWLRTLQHPDTSFGNAVEENGTWFPSVDKWLLSLRFHPNRATDELISFFRRLENTGDFDRLKADVKAEYETVRQRSVWRHRLSMLTTAGRTDYVVSYVKAGLSSWDGVSEMYRREKLYTDMTRTALAVSLYRVDTGDYPETLWALVPKYLDTVPADTLSPDVAVLKYRVEDSQVVIYSVGINGKNDGGVWDVNDRMADEAQSEEMAAGDDITDVIIRIKKAEPQS